MSGPTNRREESLHIDYRPYVDGDFDALYAIEELCFNLPERFGRRYMRQLVNATHAATWIAEEENQMAGFAIVEWSPDPGGRDAYLQTIEVDPAHRAHGIARELLSRAERSAKSAGATAIWLHVDEKNQAAIRLYQAGGFLCQGREEGYYGRGRAALIYAKPLAQITGEPAA
jgi:ribosomal-protein-alanine N-acetyltransferase